MTSIEFVDISLQNLFYLLHTHQNLILLTFPNWERNKLHDILNIFNKYLYHITPYIFLLPIISGFDDENEKFVIEELNSLSPWTLSVYFNDTLKILFTNFDLNHLIKYIEIIITDLNTLHHTYYLKELFTIKYSKQINYLNLLIKNTKIYYPYSKNTEKFMAKNLYPIKVFISGDKSSVGKTSICLGILLDLLKNSVHPSSIGYIKPVTQCEQEQSVGRLCNYFSIPSLPIGNIVFYKGYTREYINSHRKDLEQYKKFVKISANFVQEPLKIYEVENISQKNFRYKKKIEIQWEEDQEILELISNSIKQVISIAPNNACRFLIVDGVGYPSVGSITTVSNAQVACFLNLPVLLVGKPGVGDAVDSFNLNKVYFQTHGCQVIGTVFNKFDLEGYYNIDLCSEVISAYFQRYQPDMNVYGFIPKIDEEKVKFENLHQKSR